MYRTLPYLGLFAAAALLQVFLFDNLTISIYLNPLVYIVFIALLPLDTPPAAVLGAGLALGVTMDFAMGAAGINTIAATTSAKGASPRRRVWANESSSPTSWR